MESIVKYCDSVFQYTADIFTLTSGYVFRINSSKWTCWVKCKYAFVKCCQAPFTEVIPILNLPSNTRGCQMRFPQISQHNVLSKFFSLPIWQVNMTSSCSFNLYFAYYEWDWEYFICLRANCIFFSWNGLFVCLPFSIWFVGLAYHLSMHSRTFIC